MHSRIVTWRGIFLWLPLSGMLLATSSSTAPAGLQAAKQAGLVYGNDDRQAVQDTTRFPFSAIGLVKLTRGSEMYVGTGAMIGRYVALTSAHVVNGPDTSHASSIVLTAGKNGGDEPFGTARVTKVIPAPQWVASQDDGYDLAILVLDRPLGDTTGYFRIAVQPDGFFDAAGLKTAGYPTDWGMFEQATVTGRSYGMEGNVIIHDLDSEAGQSGSPIWYGGYDATARLVGLLEGSYITSSPFGTGQEGIAARIDQAAANWIEQQLASYGDASQGIAGTVTDPQVGTAHGICGLGSLQAMAAGTLVWTLCFASRRRWLSAIQLPRD